MMDEKRLQEIKARVEAATPGPWGVVKRSIQAIDPDDPEWGVTIAEEVFDDDILTDYMSENGAFIAHAREDVPWLIEEVERLRAALAGLMQFHPEDELGPTTEEYWTPEYKAAMDAARKALKGGEW